MSNAWLIAAVLLLPSLLVAILGAARGAIHTRLIAVELATSLAIILLMVLSFTFDQASSIDLALTLAVLTMPGTMLLALFQERWL
jgi:multicomponent Na+:H+ antiporter subunit F